MPAEIGSRRPPADPGAESGTGSRAGPPLATTNPSEAAGQHIAELFDQGLDIAEIDRRMFDDVPSNGRRYQQKSRDVQATLLRTRHRWRRDVELVAVTWWSWRLPHPGGGRGTALMTAGAVILNALRHGRCPSAARPHGSFDWAIPDPQYSGQ